MSTTSEQNLSDDSAKDSPMKRDIESLARTTAAKAAFDAGDVELSILTHSTKPLQQENHQRFGENLKSIVYGGMDGIITTFAVVAGSQGGGLGSTVILVLGFSNMFADALSMGMGDALSEKAEAEYINKERSREAWEFKVNPQGEVDEMVELYMNRGMSEIDAKECIGLMSKYPNFFIDVMMVEELGLQVPDPDENPWKNGLVTFLSFLFFGIFPLLTYVIFPFFITDETTLFIIACVLTAIMLFILGALKSKFVVAPWYKTGTEMMLMGSFTAAVAYVIGWVVGDILGIPV